MDLEVDLNAKIIDQQTRIWVVHPGQNRRYYNRFRDESLVFLEYPGLGLTAGILQNPDLLRQSIRYSNAIHNAALRGENVDGIDRNAFPGAADVDVSIPLRTIRHLYGAAKPGDLIIVPGKGSYSSTLFGELMSDFNPNDLVQVDRHQLPLHYRPVRWLSTHRLRNELPPELARIFEKPPAVAEIQRNESTDRFFDFAYGSYVKDGEGWVLLKAEEYSGKDPRALVAPNSVIVFSVALYNAAEHRADLAGLSIEQIVEQFYDARLISDFSLKFTSPGRYGFKAFVASLVLFTNASIALLASQHLLGRADDEAVRIQIVNSQGEAPAHMRRVEENLNYALRSMDPQELQKMARVGAQASNQVDLRSEASVRVRR